MRSSSRAGGKRICKGTRSTVYKYLGSVGTLDTNMSQAQQPSNITPLPVISHRLSTPVQIKTGVLNVANAW